MVIAEVLPTKVRGWGMGIAVCIFWTLSFAVGESLESLFNAVPPYGALDNGKQKHPTGTFFLYAVTSTFALVFVWLLVPETGNRSLEAVGARASFTDNTWEEAQQIAEDKAEGLSEVLRGNNPV